ncbi:MAG: phospho-N-acetylmuramoyl-pentapeptide-transferase [Phycisphaeraceae bacterium]|nr:phospho-N-acetylmuramoyl-pentapeptide-transferase [Phycisphaeraceae bacterium]
MVIPPMLYLLFEALRPWLSERDLYRFVGILDQVQFRALAAAGVSFLIVLLLGRRTIAFLVRQKVGDAGLTDAQALRGVSQSKANTPTMGGILIAGAILGSVLVLADISERYIQIGIIVVVWTAVLGGFDDWLKLTAARRGTGRQGLLAWEKLAFQLGLGLLAGYFVSTHGAAPDGPNLSHVLNLPFQRTYIPGSAQIAPGLITLAPLAFVAIAAVVITGMSNAVNITDGMDGLAGGIASIVAVGVTVLALIAGWPPAAQYLLVPHVAGAAELGVLGGATAGACLGFLWWNCSPAQVFMGDTGSLCLGGILGYIAVVIRQEAVVLLMSGVFLLEIGSVVVQVGYFKATGGKRVFRCAPYHHHLHLGGWAEQRIVARFWIITVLLLVVGLASLKMR